MAYPDAAWERAMKVQDVILKALSGEIHWFRAAEIVGLSARSLRRWRERYEAHGYDGLIDKRRRWPSQRRVPIAEVERVLQVYRERYRGFNVRHFHQLARRDHAVTLSYTFVKLALQAHGGVLMPFPRRSHIRPQARGNPLRVVLPKFGMRYAPLSGTHEVRRSVRTVTHFFPCAPPRGF